MSLINKKFSFLLIKTNTTKSLNVYFPLFCFSAFQYFACQLELKSATPRNHRRKFLSQALRGLVVSGKCCNFAGKFK